MGLALLKMREFSSDNRGDGFNVRGRFALGAETWRFATDDVDVNMQPQHVMSTQPRHFPPAQSSPRLIEVRCTRWTTGVAGVVVKGGAQARRTFLGFFVECVLLGCYLFASAVGISPALRHCRGVSVGFARPLLDPLLLRTDARRMGAGTHAAPRSPFYVRADH